jgi:tetratricopeptide (TPR) repeat protein
MEAQKYTLQEVKLLTSVYIEKAQVFYKLKEYNKCLEYLYKIISLNVNIHPNMYYNIACCQRELGVYKIAVNSINKAILMSKEFVPEFFIERGLSYYRLGKYEIAVRDLSDGLERIVYHPEGMRTLALCYHKLGKIQESMGIMLLAVEQLDLFAIEFVKELGQNYKEAELNSIFQLFQTGKN